MNEHAKAWVAALRSGEYQQGEACLRDAEEGTFCCLGVACDLYSKATGTEWTFVDDGIGVFLDEDSTLPEPVREWLGLESNTGSYYRSGLGAMPSLLRHNDSGHSFEEIADIIESEPKGLFVEEMEYTDSLQFAQAEDEAVERRQFGGDE